MAALTTRYLDLTLGGVACGRDCTEATIESSDADSGTTTFYLAGIGGAKDYHLVATFVQTSGPVVTGGTDPTGKPFDLIWNAVGTTVAVVVKPGGNATATAALPHYSGTVTITEPDGVMVGTAADSGSEWPTFDVKWKFTARPTIVVS